MMLKVYAFTDLARTAMAQHQTQAMKSEQTRLSTELASGQTSDPVRHLRGDTTILADIMKTQSLAQQFISSNKDMGYLLDVAQTSLTGMADTAERFVGSLIVGTRTTDPHTPDVIGIEAEAALESMVSALNMSVAGRHLFSGRATQTQPLPPAEDVRHHMLDAISGAVGSVEIEQRLDAFFAEDGAFETLVYGGSSESLAPTQISPTDSITVDLRADRQVYRDFLKSSMLAIAAKEVIGLSQNEQSRLIARALDVGLNAKDDLLAASGDIGFIQEQLELSQAQLQAQSTSAEVARTELLSLDPYETASRLEDVNTRLEFLYTVTARSRQLSFLEFMR